MKKFLMLWLPLLLIVLGGVGVGFYFLRSTPDDGASTVVEATPKYKEKTVTEALRSIDAMKYFADYETQIAAFAKLETATDSVVFVPTKSANDSFVKDTALSFDKFILYHIAVSETPINIIDGAKLKTESGQELVIVKVDANLYVRDAKGNDARLRKPIETKNGKIYQIDKVLLTQ
jgi:uncharacterized surface protein with fasciclin (FAS1) repeats